MTALLENHGGEKEVQQIASEWGDWLERNNNWEGSSPFRKGGQGGGKAIAFMLSKLAGRTVWPVRVTSLAMMRKAQQRAAQEMNAGGLKKVCDYWWRHGGKEMCRLPRMFVVVTGFAQDRPRERCCADEDLVTDGNSREDPAFPSKVERVEESDCEPAQWEVFWVGFEV